MAGEGEFKQEMVPLSFGALEDADGRSADAYLTERLMEMESHIKDYRRTHGGEASDKPYTITLEIAILPDKTGKSRSIGWKVHDLKTPKMARSHTQFAVGREGMIFAAQDKQERMNFGPPKHDSETGETH